MRKGTFGRRWRSLRWGIFGEEGKFWKAVDKLKLGNFRSGGEILEGDGEA